MLQDGVATSTIPEIYTNPQLIDTVSLGLNGDEVSSVEKVPIQKYEVPQSVELDCPTYGHRMEGNAPEIRASAVDFWLPKGTC